MEKIKLLINLLPMLISLIKDIEAAIPEKGQGAVKLAMIKEILISADSAISALWPFLEIAIGTLVKGFNASGVFKK